MSFSSDDSDDDSITEKPTTPGGSGGVGNRRQSSAALEEGSSSKSSTSAGPSGGSNESDKKVRFVQKETRYVFFLRLSVLLVLLFAAAAVSLLVFFITNGSESESMETNYHAAADKILDTFESIATEKMGAAGSFVVALVAHGLAMQHSWPFVTMTSFQERAATVKKLSGALYIGINPLVLHKDRAQWEEYSNGPASAWYHEARLYQQQLDFDQLDNRPQVNTTDPNLNLTSGIANHIYDFKRDATGEGIISPDEEFYLPIWQTSPVTRRTMVNQNRASNSANATHAMKTNEVVFAGMQRSTPGYGNDSNPVTAEIAWLLRLANRKETKYQGDIYSTAYFSIYNDFVDWEERHSVGVMRIIFHWARYFENILPDSTQGIILVLDNGCDVPYTYQVDGPLVTPLGDGDLHDEKFNRYERRGEFEHIKTIEDGTAYGMRLCNETCPYGIRVYPSDTFVASYDSKTPLVVTFSVACVFLFTVFMFFVYDRLVERRQNILMRKATQTHDIVASLFPKNVRDQLLQEDKDEGKKGFVAPNHRLKNFLCDGKDDNNSNQAPIADLYPNATVLFADISGFTAWSSSREPAQVFILLQSVYQAFDNIAKQRKVFKVETIGDSYVAVTGLPEPQSKHAIIMARFAQECLLKMLDVTRELEKTLGPDTGELMMRFGLHSGPVTAGVLRGERSRFQLFGDTVNTAARMESTGTPGKIQCTQSTAELLSKGGKEHWVRPRQDSVIAKGKGVLKTFWITPYAGRAASTQSSETGTASDAAGDFQVRASDTRADRLLKHERLVEWIVEIFQESIRQIVAQRKACKKQPGPLHPLHRLQNSIPLDEVVEAIKLADFDATAVNADMDAVEIPADILENLRAYVSIISSTYRDNPFHNFEHACHVTMSVSKFLKRIVTPEVDPELVSQQDRDKIAKHLHDYTHGITSDPISIFAIVFSALIHDVDHRGVSNAQLMKEEIAMATTFRNKSVAEQNSVDIAWELFMTDRFKVLRSYIFANQSELCRFRQVMINVVLATDIFDKELNDLRRARWEKAFSEASDAKSNAALRATIVIEHIMQASDVCHTMQHWHIYRKWNQRLFFEMLKAYKAGRLGADPAGFWYKGELGFFDSYIIPLANKLKDCNVFGVSSDECLNYALRNRAEWEELGEGIVAEMVAEFNGKL